MLITFHRQFKRMLQTMCLIAAMFALPGCLSDFQTNPSFAISNKAASQLLDEHRNDPGTLQRPVVVLGGFKDPGFVANSVAAKLRRVFEDGGNIIAISFLGNNSFDSCRNRLLREVAAAFPSGFENETIEVDVIGISMGGLVARHSARELFDENGNPQPRLRIKRLFTIGTPHQGAKLAGLPTFDKRQRDMRAGSNFLETLNADATSQDFEIVTYARLGDAIVGVANSAMPGKVPWWVPSRPFMPSHLTVASDSRILADIVLRLRGDDPLTGSEPTPLPD